MRLVLALLVLALPPAAPPTAGAAVAEGCAARDDGFVCRWEFDSPDPERPPYDWREFPVPHVPHSLVTVTVLLEGRGGWTYDLEREVPEEPGVWRRWATRTHVVQAEEARGSVASETLFHVAPAEDSLGHRLAFLPVGAAENPRGVVARAVPAEGRFRVIYEVSALPQGVAPPRPAATREDPHLGGVEGDAVDGGTDLVAAWFDDARVGDGLLEAHVALADLSELPSDVVQWRLLFSVLGEGHTLVWTMGAEDEQRSQECFLVRGRVPDDSLSRLDNVGTLLCRFDESTSTLSASFPERSIGSPGDGVRFTDLYAVALRRDVAYSFERQDRLEHERYPFALGGPAVWDALNPRLAVAPAPWYADPLAAEHVADTLQVLGAAGAALGFVVGLAFVRRRRARTKRFLDEVDAVVLRLGHDARAALLALGELESRFDALYRRGAMHESEYQLASQRIATAATRFALRRELGLDDGTPGEAPVEVRA